MIRKVCHGRGRSPYRSFPRDLEFALLKAIANAKSDEWLPLSIGVLRNRIRDVDSAAANETINRYIDAIASLGAENVLLIRKGEDGGRPVPFDSQKQNDDGYTSNFFARGDFEPKLTHEGRKRLAEAPTQAATAGWAANSGRGACVQRKPGRKNNSRGFRRALSQSNNASRIAGSVAGVLDCES